MKKSFKFYLLIWAILLVLWAIIVFLVRPTIPGYVSNYDASFWIIFVLFFTAFASNLVCAYFALKTESLKKMFLNLPLISINWSSLIVVFVTGSVLMIIPNSLVWITAIACIVIFAFNIITIIKAYWASKLVNDIDEKIDGQISFIKNLTQNTSSLLARAKSDSVKTECKKVYDSVRYSDPMSNQALAPIEAEITVRMNELSVAVSTDNEKIVSEIADQIVILIDDRNKQCKLMK